jgi:hypothetical protein
MKISGHKSVTSLQSYHDRTTENCQQSISQTIGNAVTKVGTQEAIKPRDKNMEHVNKSPISPVSSVSLRSPPGSPLTLNIQQPTKRQQINQICFHFALSLDK